MGRITKIELLEFTYPVENVGPSEDGYDTIYMPDTEGVMSSFATRIETSDGLVGEYVGGMTLALGQTEYLAKKIIGRNAFHRLAFYEEFKRGLRKFDKMGAGALDIALWDWAGKRLETSVARLLGSSRTKLPAYASTYHGDPNGGLTTPEDYADFAEHCKALGYTAFKMHGWTDGNVKREADAIRMLRDRVGPDTALMLDPACQLRTLSDALLVGRACDEAKFLWWEDPFRDGGLSHSAHKVLRERVTTPILVGEHMRGLESKADLAVSGACDFVRVNPNYDMGITGAMKVAHMAESLGLDVEIHGAGPAQRHCMAAYRNTNYYELALVGPKSGSSYPPVYACSYSDALEAVDSDGTFPVPAGNGLGVEYDWDFIRKHATNATVLQ
jgi:L-alanine-DL-glutamate epimerase-like enolase superfamily enzyme